MKYGFLNESEKQSPIWLKIREYLKEELNDLRQKNDSEFGNISEIETAKIRGAISCIKDLLDIDCPVE